MVWTPEQTAVFLKAARRHRLHGLWRLIATRGLRRGEGCGLRRGDTDLSVALTTVRWQITQLGWKTVQGAPKSDAGDRTVALDAGTVADIRRHRCEQDTEREKAGDAWAGGGFEFTDEHGGPLHPADVTYAFHMIAYLAGLPPVRLHDLRHGAATLLLAAGHGMKVVQARRLSACRRSRLPATPTPASCRSSPASRPRTSPPSSAPPRSRHRDAGQGRRQEQPGADVGSPSRKPAM
jgi:integrase